MAKRKGQKTFRSRKVKGVGQCEATLSSLIFCTDACHIKPYSVCGEEEKNDPNNAILLLSSIHRAFDHGLISFDDQGNILTSLELEQRDIECLGLTGTEKIRMPGKRKEYMKYHRENIFKDKL